MASTRGKEEFEEMKAGKGIYIGKGLAYNEELVETDEDRLCGYMVSYPEVANEDELRHGIVTLNVRSYKYDSLKKEMELQEPEPKKFKIVEGYLKDAKGEHFVDLGGNIVDETKKIEAYRSYIIVQTFERPECGLSYKDIPRIDESRLGTRDKIGNFFIDIRDKIKNGWQSWRKERALKEKLEDMLKGKGIYQGKGLKDNEELIKTDKVRCRGYMVSCPEVASEDELKQGIVTLRVRSYKPKGSEIDLQEPELKKFKIVDGYLKDAEGKNFVDLGGNIVNETEKIEAYRNPIISEAFTRPEYGLGPENIPRAGESFTQTYNKYGTEFGDKAKGFIEGVWNKLKNLGSDILDGFRDIGRSIKKAKGFWGTLNAIASGILRPFKYIVRSVVDFADFVLDKTGIKESGFGKAVANSELAKSFVRHYKDMFDNPKRGFDTLISPFIDVYSANKSELVQREFEEMLRGKEGAYGRKGLNVEEHLVEADGHECRGYMVSDVELKPEQLDISINELKQGIFTLNVRNYGYDNLSQKIKFQEQELKKFRIVKGYLKDAEGKNFVDLGGNIVDESKKIRASSQPAIIEAFSKPDYGIDADDIIKENLTFDETTKKYGPKLDDWEKFLGEIEESWESYGFEKKWQDITPEEKKSVLEDKEKAKEKELRKDALKEREKKLDEIAQKYKLTIGNSEKFIADIEKKRESGKLGELSASWKGKTTEERLSSFDKMSQEYDVKPRLWGRFLGVLETVWKSDEFSESWKKVTSWEERVTKQSGFWATAGGFFAWLGCKIFNGIRRTSGLVKDIYYGIRESIDSFKRARGVGGILSALRDTFTRPFKYVYRKAVSFFKEVVSFFKGFGSQETSQKDNQTTGYIQKSETSKEKDDVGKDQPGKATMEKKNSLVKAGKNAKKVSDFEKGNKVEANEKHDHKKTDKAK